MKKAITTLVGLGILGTLRHRQRVASGDNPSPTPLTTTVTPQTTNFPTKKVLVTVSGTIAPDIRTQIANGQRPVADYLAMADTFDADLLDYPRARRLGGKFGQLLEKVGGANLLLAWICYRERHHYHVIFTDGEQIGIPLALLTKFLAPTTLAQPRPRHLMIVHILSVGKKMLFFDYLGIQSEIDTFFAYSTWQKRFIQQRWHVPEERIVFTPFMVDADFFAAEQIEPEPTPSQAFQHTEGVVNGGDAPMICAVGLEFRDYPTLIEAVKDLDLHLVIAAGSPWSKRADSTKDQKIPENVTVRRFTQHQLRQVYAQSRFLVMPLYNVNFQAGVTALLEAMSMSKAVICSQTPGQTDVVVQGETGLYVPPADAQALREAIKYLLRHPDEAERMGKAGRRRIEEEMSLRRYVERLKAYVHRQP